LTETDQDTRCGNTFVSVDSLMKACCRQPNSKQTQIVGRRRGADKFGARPIRSPQVLARLSISTCVWTTIGGSKYSAGFLADAYIDSRRTNSRQNPVNNFTVRYTKTHEIQSVDSGFGAT
jgi:hypothetical protein